MSVLVAKRQEEVTDSWLDRRDCLKTDKKRASHAPQIIQEALLNPHDITFFAQRPQESKRLKLDRFRAYQTPAGRGVFNWLLRDGALIEAAWVERRDAARWMSEVEQRWFAGQHTLANIIVKQSDYKGPALPLTIHAYGSEFQCRVWQALLKVAWGEQICYSDVADDMGSKAVRAVGSAIGKNPLAPIIPCHRVVRSDGGLGGYHWGLAIKRDLMGIEV